MEQTSSSSPSISAGRGHEGAGAGAHMRAIDVGTELAEGHEGVGVASVPTTPLGTQDDGRHAHHSSLIDHDIHHSLMGAGGLGMQQQAELEYYRNAFQGLEQQNQGLEQQKRMLQDELADRDWKHKQELDQWEAKLATEKQERKSAIATILKGSQEKTSALEARLKDIESLNARILELETDAERHRQELGAVQSAAPSTDVMEKAATEHTKVIAALKKSHEGQLARLADELNKQVKHYRQALLPATQQVEDLKAQLLKEKEGMKALREELAQHKESVAKEKKQLEELAQYKESAAKEKKQLEELLQAEADKARRASSDRATAVKENAQLREQLAAAMKAEEAAQQAAESARKEARDSAAALSSFSSAHPHQESVRDLYARRVQARDALIKKQVAQLKELAENAQKLQASLAGASRDLQERYEHIGLEDDAEDDTALAASTGATAVRGTGASFATAKEVEALRKKLQEDVDTATRESEAAKKTSAAEMQKRRAERAHWLQVVSKAMKAHEKTRSKILKYWAEDKYSALRAELVELASVPEVSASSPSASLDPSVRSSAIAGAVTNSSTAAIAASYVSSAHLSSAQSSAASVSRAAIPSVKQQTVAPDSGAKASKRVLIAGEGVGEPEHENGAHNSRDRKRLRMSDSPAPASGSSHGTGGAALFSYSLPRNTPSGPPLADLFPATKAQQEEMLRRRGLKVKDVWNDWYMGNGIAVDSSVRLSPRFTRDQRNAEVWKTEEISGTIGADTPDDGKTTDFYVVPHHWWDDFSSDVVPITPDTELCNIKIYFPQLWILIFNEEDGEDGDASAVDTLLRQIEVKVTDPITRSAAGVWKSIHGLAALPRGYRPGGAAGGRA